MAHFSTIEDSLAAHLDFGALRTRSRLLLLGSCQRGSRLLQRDSWHATRAHLHWPLNN